MIENVAFEAQRTVRFLILAVALTWIALGACDSQTPTGVESLVEEVRAPIPTTDEYQYRHLLNHHSVMVVKEGPSQGTYELRSGEWVRVR